MKVIGVDGFGVKEGNSEKSDAETRECENASWLEIIIKQDLFDSVLSHLSRFSPFIVTFCFNHSSVL